MNVLVGCEESQVVCIAFRRLGHEAYSCDLQECSGGHPEWHLQMDVFEAIELIKPDLGIFHPPCTYLSVSGATWYYHPEDNHLPYSQRRPHPKYPDREKDREKAVEFFMKCVNSDIQMIAVENPVSIMSTRYRIPDQIIEPYYFGHAETKKTCLWLKNLPLLIHTSEDNLFEQKTHVKPEYMMNENGEYYRDKGGSRYSRIHFMSRSNKERAKERSKTYQGIADAMAEQWGKINITK